MKVCMHCPHWACGSAEQGSPRAEECVQDAAKSDPCSVPASAPSPTAPTAGGGLPPLEWLSHGSRAGDRALFSLVAFMSLCRFGKR